MAQLTPHGWFWSLVIGGRLRAGRPSRLVPLAELAGRS